MTWFTYFSCCTFVVHCCYPLVSPLKCEYSYTVYTVVKFHLLAKQAANGTCIKCVKCYHGIESTSADLAQSQNCLGIEALDLTGEGDINEIDDIDSNDVPSSSSFHVFQCQLIENLWVCEGENETALSASAAVSEWLGPMRLIRIPGLWHRLQVKLYGNIQFCAHRCLYLSLGVNHA